jgi:hypothetical protein
VAKQIFENIECLRECVPPPNLRKKQNKKSWWENGSTFTNKKGSKFQFAKNDAIFERTHSPLLACNESVNISLNRCRIQASENAASVQLQKKFFSRGKLMIIKEMQLRKSFQKIKQVI